VPFASVKLQMPKFCCVLCVVTYASAVKAFEVVEPVIFVSAETQKNPTKPLPGPIVMLSVSGPTAHVSLPDDFVPEVSTTIDQNPESDVSST
jgi:hypothetical protein